MRYRNAIAGSLGFGIGFAVFHLMRAEGFLPLFVPSALGSLSLGLVNASLRKVVAYTVIGSTVFGIGTIVGVFIFLVIWDPIGTALFGVISGALLGIAIGMLRKSLIAAFVMAIAGAVGFGLGWWATGTLNHLTYPVIGEYVTPQPLWTVGLFGAVTGILGGVMLGAAVDLLDARAVTMSNTENETSAGLLR